MPRLLLHEMRSFAAMCAILLILLLVISILIHGRSGLVRGALRFLASQRLLIFAPESLRTTPADVEIYNQLGWYAFFVACVSVRFPVIVRHLRTLPLGSRCTLCSSAGPRSSGAWCGSYWRRCTWRFGAALSTPQIPLLLALIGLSAFSQALSLRFKPWRAQAGGGAAFIVIPFAMLAESGPAWLLPGLAALSMAGAVFHNRSALARAETYKNTIPFGMKPQGV